MSQTRESLLQYIESMDATIPVKSRVQIANTTVGDNEKLEAENIRNRSSGKESEIIHDTPTTDTVSAASESVVNSQNTLIPFTDFKPTDNTFYHLINNNMRLRSVVVANKIADSLLNRQLGNFLL
jgi:hypothetical protein